MQTGLLFPFCTGHLKRQSTVYERKKWGVWWVEIARELIRYQSYMMRSVEVMFPHCLTAFSMTLWSVSYSSIFIVSNFLIIKLPTGLLSTEVSQLKSLSLVWQGLRSKWLVWLKSSGHLNHEPEIQLTSVSAGNPKHIKTKKCRQFVRSRDTKITKINEKKEVLDIR